MGLLFNKNEELLENTTDSFISMRAYDTTDTIVSAVNFPATSIFSSPTQVSGEETATTSFVTNETLTFLIDAGEEVEYIDLVSEVSGSNEVIWEYTLPSVETFTTGGQLIISDIVITLG